MDSLFKVCFRGATAVLMTGAAAAGCFASGSRPGDPGQPAPPVVVDLTTQAQRIDGFGASSAWTANNMSDAMADLFFTTDKGIGLSLLRIQIKPTGMTYETATAQKAVARGAKVWAAPWTPPVAWKTGTDACGYGGSLLDEHRQDWANSLASFASSMSAQGIPLVALSAQNEPNYHKLVTNGDCSTSWDSCLYDPTQLVTFVRDFLGPALAAQAPGTLVMAPETQGWDQFQRYAGPLMADPAAVALMGPLATHHYAGSPSIFAPAAAANKVVWETEVSDQTTYNAGDPPINSALRVAQMIHADLADGSVSAWHYWWLMPAKPNAAYDSLSQDGTTLSLRAWVLGNWSRFVRPGFVRVVATETPQEYVSVSAFTGAASGTVVVVAINQARYHLNQDFTITGGTAASVTPWVTSATQKLEAQAPIAVDSYGTFSTTLPAQSVTTFVGPVATP